MVFRLEEAVAAVAAPDVRGDSAELRTCVALFDGSRYFMYAAGALVVVLVENQDAATPLNPRSEARRPSQFDLWQVWTCDDVVRCIRFNSSRKAARGAIALCVDEGRGVLLMPCGAGASSKPTATTTSSSSSRANEGSSVGVSSLSSTATATGYAGDVTSDYTKVHLHLQMTTWRESVRWKSEDRLMDRLEWVESGADDLLLVGAGEKITIWKLVDDAVQVYLQRSFSLRCGADRSVRHFDATSGAGRFLATAAAHDRVVKVWHLDAFDHDGAPMCQFLAHQRAIEHVQWSKDCHTFKLRASSTPAAAVHCEMLFTLDRVGTVLIWRENVATRSFVLWKLFSGQDYLSQPESERFFFDADRSTSAAIRTLGLVSHAWARPTASTLTSIPDAMLDESNVLAALAMFHYGCSSLDDARRSELYSQRMGGSGKMNGKLLGDKCGAIADTHAGETFICGNTPLSKTFAVYLLYGVHDNGDLCLFRTEFIPFSGVTPKVSLLLIFSGLRAQLVNSTIVSICSSDYRDRENGSSTFVIEIVFQSRSVETHVRVARLKLQADSASFGGARGTRGSVCYSVQSCEVGDLCDCVFGAQQLDGTARSLAISKARAVKRATAPLNSVSTAGQALKVAVANIDGRLDIFRPSASLRKLQIMCRPHPSAAMREATHTCCFEEQSVLFFFANGKLQAATTAAGSESSHRSASATAAAAVAQLPPLLGGSSARSASFQMGSQPSAATSTHAVMCFEDENEDCGDAVELDELVLLRVPETLKREWALSSTQSIFRSSLVPSSACPSTDYCVVIGLERDGADVLVWVFSFEPLTSPTVSPRAAESSEDVRDDDLDLGSPPSPPRPHAPVSMTLHRKVRVPSPRSRFVCLSSVPSIEPFELVFATIDAQFQLDVWTFADADDLTELKIVQSTDVGALIKASTASEKPADAMSFHVVDESVVFKMFALSACGRVAVLFERTEARADALAQQQQPRRAVDANLCILPLLESCAEGIVVLEHKKLGAIVSLEWTPPVTPERACELLFLSTTAIGVVTCDASLPTNKWSIAWSSSRFSVKPQRISSLTSYPHALLALEASVASVNLHDLSGATTAGAHSGLPFRISQSPGLLEPSSVPPSTVYGVHHPATLMFLLLRGSFRSLETALTHVKTSILEHKKTCYLRMMDDAPLTELPLLSLAKLLGPTGCDSDVANGADQVDDERSAVYLNGKQSSSTGFGSSSSTAAAPPARASDLFAMDYRSSRSNLDRAEMLFAPRSALGHSSAADSTEDGAASTTAATAAQTQLTDPVFAAFFSDHRAHLTFLSPEEADAFLSIVHGIRKTVAWERDSSRKKDAAALRFHASLLWPLQPVSERDSAAAKTTSSASRSASAADAGMASEPSDADDPDSAESESRAIGICSEQVVWGAITDCQDELLQECFPTPMVTWREMQQLRLPFWVKSVAKLQQFTERAAQSEFASTRDPFHVALFYVLLGKTKLLASLFKMSNETRIYELLSNDFADPRWKTAAIKNAYVLKAKRRYELSTAFFLLGGKVQEAMAVAEHADRTLVLSLLIARLSERWDLGGESSEGASSGDFGQFSFSGLSSSMRSSLAGMSSLAGSANASGCKGACVEYLKTAVWTRAEACGDVYMRFLVKYLTGETQSGVQCLLSVPSVEMRCMFGTCGKAYAYPYTLYWRAFGQSMLGACEIVRYLERTIVPLKISVKTQIMRLQTLALSRIHSMGLHTAALVQQRDFASFAVQFARDKPQTPETAAFLACRHQILVAALGAQVDALYAAFLARVRDSMIGKRAPSSVARPELETEINDEIRCLVIRGGAFTLDAVLETAHTHVEGMLRHSVVRSLVHSCRLVGLDFLVAGWRALAGTEPARALLPQFTSPLPHFIDVISDGIALVASGDLVASATDQLHTRRVDQTCAQLLAAASRLLLWLSYYYSKPSEQRTCISSSEYVRVAAAAIYSVICVCVRYLRSPCCLYRALGAIFPHKDALPKKVIDELQEIALADVCVYCAAARSAQNTSRASAAAVSSLQQDIPALYLVVEMLQSELDALVADVKTNRLQLAAATSSPFFTYCQYWTLVLMMSTSGMPAHVTKIAVDGAHPMSDSTLAAKKLVQVWSAYNTRLAKCGARKLLCDLAALYFRPFDVASGASGSSASSSSSVSAGGDAKSSASSASVSVSTTSPSASGTSSLSSSPTKKDGGSRDPRRLLGCSCTRCPWLLLVKLFAEKDEFLLRVHAQLECCSEKIKDEIRWGHLPDFPSKKAVLTRSQKILLSTAAGAGKTPGTPRAADLVDLFEKRLQTQAPVVLQTSCIYRSEVSIKSMCFNRATETPEMILCSSKGICRTGCADYSDGSKFQFKGMYANPQASFFSDAASLPMAPMRRKTTADTVGGNSSANSDLSAAIGPPLSIGSRMLAGGSPSPSSLLSSASASPSDSKVPSFKPTAVESHPFLPLFASGNQKGKVHLWSYDSLSAVCSFQTDDVVAPYPSSPSLSSRRDVKKIKFDNLGQQMGAVDTLGRLFMWKFSSLDRETCYRQIECHDKGAKALTFINAGSCVATVGSSTDKKSVCMWDLLLPTSKALVAAPVCHPAGAASAAFSSTHQLLISGGEGGSISVFDVRQRRVLHTVSNAHETAITTLELHPSGHCVLSGSASGDVKIWSLPIFREITALSKVHAKPSFLGDAASNILGDAASNMAINVTNSSWGVTDAVATDDYFFTSGTDGSVQRMRVPSLSKLF